MSFVLNYLIDRLLFGIALLIGIQLPHAVQQYQQTLITHRQEIQFQLAHLPKSSADRIIENTPLWTLPHDQTLDMIPVQAETTHTLQRHHRHLSKQLAALQNQPLYRQLWYLTRHIDVTIGQQTWAHYVADIRLTQLAITSGLLFAFVASVMLGVMRLLFSLCRPKRKQSPTLFYRR